MADLSALVTLGAGRSPIMPPNPSLTANMTAESMRLIESAGGAVVSSQFMEVVFGWAAVGGAESYQLEIGTTSGASDYAVLNVGNVLTFTANLPPGTYYSRVKAVTGGVPGTASAEQGPFYV